MALEKIKMEGKPCQLCNSNSIDEFKFGPLFQLQEFVLHHFCLLFSYATEQNGDDNEGILGFLPKDIDECLTVVRQNICCFCSKPNASVKCSNQRCDKIFHFPCGIENGSLHQFKGRFHSFCSKHRPKQRVPSEVLGRAQSEPPVCLICLDEIDASDQFRALWASCCRFTWYHRDCLQKYAYSTGWFFLRCVACRNKTKFKRLVEQYGIYVPKRDASWEMVPHAYEDLYINNFRCEAEECICPRGREFRSTRGPWSRLMCLLCGSRGIHFRCKSSRGESWECQTCRSALSPRWGNPPEDSTTTYTAEGDPNTDLESGQA